MYLFALAEEKCIPQLKGFGTSVQGMLLALTGKPSDAVRALTSGLAGERSTGATGAALFFLSNTQGGPYVGLWSIGQPKKDSWAAGTPDPLGRAGFPGSRACFSWLCDARTPWN